MYITATKFRFLLNRFREKLWVRPLVVCLLSIAAALAAKYADDTVLAEHVPYIKPESIETLLSIMSASMLMIATFSVGAMVSAYTSASNTATPRSFSLVVADDVSQNALSTFVGAFIFSIVAITAVKNHFYGSAGLFILFLLTAIAFGLVIITFVRWVDRIARLGLLGSTIEKVEKATASSLKHRRDAPTLCGSVAQSKPSGQKVFATKVGYVQHIDIESLQAWAEKTKVRVMVAALPGTLVHPGKPLAHIADSSHNQADIDSENIIKCFQVGRNRTFENDPRFGLVALSEIAGRALSPAVNDPGTAIDIIGTLIRLFTLWNDKPANELKPEPKYDRIEVPELSIQDMFDDAFTSISRDGAKFSEVAIRLQKAFYALATIHNKEMQKAAKYHSKLALKRSQNVMDMEEDIAEVQKTAQLIQATE